jgi:UDP:flavonoid glycosyltransferase YjiC (YdhE family)
MAESKPKLIFCVTPVYGHVMPMRALAKEIISRGFEVTFVTGASYQREIEILGATFIPLGGIADPSEKALNELTEGTMTDPPMTSKYAFIDTIPEQFKAFQTGVDHIKHKDPDAQIIVLTEGFYFGTLPGILGAPGVEVLGYIGVGVLPMLLSSIDVPPFFSGLLPDSSTEGQKRNKELTKAYNEYFHVPNEAFSEICQELGAGATEIFYQDAAYWLPHRFLQMCIPAIEFHRSDAPPNLRFAGGLRPGLRDPATSFPEWWEDVTINSHRRHIVFVSQGTLQMNIDELIVPTMLALKDDENFIVVVAIGKTGSSIPAEISIPKNARVADFIPYDEILKYADVFVSNGGYGAVQHSLGNGVPLVVGGFGSDKADNALRVEWAGVGIDLKTHRPEPKTVYEAVTNILENTKYRERAKELQAEMQSYDSVEILIENIEDVVRERTTALKSGMLE